MKSSLPLLAAAGAAVLSSGCFSFRVGSLEPVDDGCEWVSSSKLVATESTAVSELEPLVVLPDAAERALSNGVSIGLTGKEELVETVEDTCMKAVVYRQRMMTFGLWPVAELRAEGIRLLPDRVEFTAVRGTVRMPALLHIPGRFSVYNALAALACCALLAAAIAL